jgi:hypothetical protein
MVTHLMRINQLSKIRERPLVFTKCRVFWMYDFGYCFGNRTILSVKVTPKKIWACGRRSSLILDSLEKS